MRAFKPVLSGKGLLAASIALLSSQALAESAGRVSFVTGEVTASASDGTTRQLRRGDTINGGDKISTRAGRLQIRFTDGGFVSLQPNTVFGVDQYLYANKPPEETSLFFSLLQGGMRTVTGAIGKVNKQSYKVRTPVATIGIRGTGYLASLSERGLIVSVGSGFVNVANDSGDITAGAGQNISVRDKDGKPGLSSEAPDVQATGTEGDREELAAENSQDSDLQQTVSIGNVLNENGNYLFLFTTDTNDAPLPDSNPVTGEPSYFIESPALVNQTGPGAPTSVLATFDQDGSVSGTKGALLSTFYMGEGIQTSFERGDLQVVNVGTKNDLSWGEFTNGSTSTNQLFSAPSFLGENNFLPYIIGKPATDNLGHGTATYVWQGGTKPRNQSGAEGTMDSFSIIVNLDFATIDLAMQITMPVNPVSTDSPPLSPQAAAVAGASNTYTVTTNQPVGIINLGSAQNFSLDSSYLEVSDSNGNCSGSGSSCSAAVRGFFVGDSAAQIGASYFLYDNGDSISGVAALGLQSYNGNTVLASGDGYTVAYAKHSSVGIQGGYTGIDVLSNTYYEDGLYAAFDSNGLLSDATRYSESIVFDRGNALADNRGQSGPLTWGRWYSNNAQGDSVTIAGESATLNQSTASSKDYLHYIAGSLTQPGAFAGINHLYGNGAKATYTFAGGTTATATDGSTGSINSNSKLTVTFNSIPTLAVDVGITMSSGSNYKLSASSISVTGATFAASSGSGGLGCSTGGSGGSCGANISGFFAGQQAEGIGMSYEINDFNAGRHVNGAGGFVRGAITPAQSSGG